ncbi:hypothetical protein [Dactylococcopsis salina]|uniref:hypothetical protein n=1 Tax=Dactylococcopsis salina TaxID=292566 RepID=UPI0012EB02D5|nr:hypothetical protein [Dactylococcopsis salina]
MSPLSPLSPLSPISPLSPLHFFEGLRALKPHWVKVSVSQQETLFTFLDLFWIDRAFTDSLYFLFPTDSLGRNA